MSAEIKAYQFFCVIESPEAFFALSRKFKGRLHNVRLFCSCSETGFFLEEKGLEYEPVSEKMFEGEWQEINTWAKRASLAWYRERRVSEVLSVGGVNLGDLCNRPISHALIDQLKNYRLACLIAERIRNEKFIFLGKPARLISLGKFGSGSVNDILKFVIGKEPARCVYLTPFIRRSLKSIVLNWLRGMVGFFYRKSRVFELGKNVFVGVGTLKILLPVLKELSKNTQCCFLDLNFQWVAYRTCRKQKIRYCLVSSFLSPAERKRSDKRLTECLSTLKAERSVIEGLPCFQYQGKRIPGLFDRVLDALERKGPDRLLQSAMLRNIQKWHGVKACLLHEDADQLRGFVVEAKTMAIPVVVISHGVPPARSDWSKIAEGVGIADIIVNSEFEKSKYVMAGYSVNQLHVLGLPRYDAIYKRLKESKNEAGPSKAVLYCPHMLTRVTKRQKGYLGIHTPGGVTRYNSVALFKAIRNIDCELFVKPHGNSEDLRLWDELIAKENNSKICRLPHSADIFKLIAFCDLVVATFSTVVVEAMLFQKDIITMNFTSMADIHPYAQRGIAYGVYRPEDLEEAIRKCLFDATTQLNLKAARMREMQYFGGPFDGENTRRVVSYIERLTERMPLGQKGDNGKIAAGSGLEGSGSDRFSQCRLCF